MDSQSEEVIQMKLLCAHRLFVSFVTVNNVGMSISDSFTYFLETPDAEQVSLSADDTPGDDSGEGSSP